MNTQNELVKELFSFLDIVEVSGNGSEFHPIYISCGRSTKMKKLVDCIKALRESIDAS